MDHQQQKTLALAWEKLAPALGSDLRTIQREVKQGVAQLAMWGDHEFFTVLRPEVCAQGKELVIVAAAGKNSLKYLAEIKRLAIEQGFYSIRLHTLKPAAMLRMSDSVNLGFAPAETILRAVL
ncbi:hypothetical protein I6M59_10370 [Shewanella algae]|uniref:hypothetical protein n=1 Tax=Shewanella algae TaxID=38313 RepID=UPI001AAF49DF|nr:hypothetical protein [Shewanella algae]MBO2692148.1 hypothetical protein [Shewanella algae]